MFILSQDHNRKKYEKSNNKKKIQRFFGTDDDDVYCCTRTTYGKFKIEPLAYFLKSKILKLKR
jgi:hypothetical protein